MSGIDQAFIKAFRKDPDARGVAVPHVTDQVQNAHATTTADARPEAAPAVELERPAVPTSQGPSPGHSHMAHSAVDTPRGSVSGPHWSLANTSTASPSTQRSANLAALPTWARPAYEVDRFAWSDVCRQLVSAIGGQLDATVKILLDQSRAGKQVVYVSGTGRREGSTTVLLCLAQRLASIGVKCALVDANFECPSVAQSLGISPVVGWEDVARQQHGIAEVMIQSEEDHLAVLPLRSPLSDARILANDLHWSVTMATLRQHYQVVLIDGPSSGSPSASAIMSLESRAGIDTAILVSADANAALHELTDATNQLTSAGVEVLGVIENVCRAASFSSHGSPSTAQIA